MRPITEQVLPININIDCKKSLRNIDGTLPLAKELKVCQETKNGEIYEPKCVLSDKQLIYPVDS